MQPQDLQIRLKVEEMITYAYAPLRNFPKSERHVLSAEIRRSMLNLLRLVVVVNRHGRGLDFLGYHLWPHKRRLRKASLKRFKRRVRRLQRQYAARTVGFTDIRQQLSSWIAHARHGDATPAVSKYLANHPFRRDPDE